MSWSHICSPCWGLPQSTGLLFPQTALILCLTVSFTESSSIACLKQNCGFPSRNMALPQVFFISAKGSTIYLVSQTQYLERHPCVWGYIQVHECCKLYLHIHPCIHLSLSLPPSLSLSDGQCLSMEAQTDCGSHPFMISRYVIVHLFLCVCVCVYIYYI